MEGFAEEKSKNQKNKIIFTHVNMVNTGQELSYDNTMYGILVYVLRSIIQFRIILNKLIGTDKSWDFVCVLFLSL